MISTHLSACSASFAFWTSSSFSPLILGSSLVGGTLKRQQVLKECSVEGGGGGTGKVEKTRSSKQGGGQHQQLPAPLAVTRGAVCTTSRRQLAAALGRQVAEAAPGRACLLQQIGWQTGHNPQGLISTIISMLSLMIPELL